MPELEFLSSPEFFRKWYAAFANGVDKHIMQEHVKAAGCMPWHIFTWGDVDCISGDEALRTWFNIAKGEDVYVFEGYDYEDGVAEVRPNDKIELTKGMKNGNEVFIAALDFSWTFVWTHEGYCFGPYFCSIK